MRQLSSRPGRLSVIALIALVATACSGSGRRAEPARTRVRVSERDFHISATPNHVAPGNVLLVVRNHGPDTHELIVVRSHSRLPLRLDGLTIDEDALSALTVGSLDGAGPGSERQLQLHLAR